PNGRALIWGGLDAADNVVTSGLWFDPSSNAISTAADVQLIPRAGHTATVLTDGRVLFAGGWSSDAGWIATAEVWDPRAKLPVAALQQADARVGAIAQLEADGRISFAQGQDRSGRIEDVATFDPASDQFSFSPDVASEQMTTPALNASIPANEAKQVP